jgi:hypothetical protein
MSVNADERFAELGLVLFQIPVTPFPPPLLPIAILGSVDYLSGIGSIGVRGAVDRTSRPKRVTPQLARRPCTCSGRSSTASDRSIGSSSGRRCSASPIGDRLRRPAQRPQRLFRSVCGGVRRRARSLRALRDRHERPSTGDAVEVEAVVVVRADLIEA